MKEEDVGALILILGIAALCISGVVSISRDTTSDYWKTEIVRHGYGTWETTPEGKVWFKWKENNQLNIHERYTKN